MIFPTSRHFLRTLSIVDGYGGLAGALGLTFLEGRGGGDSVFKESNTSAYVSSSLTIIVFFSKTIFEKVVVSLI